MSMRKANAMIGTLFLSAIGLNPTAALADWQYTRWGMSPDQAVQSSNGALKKISKMANDGTLMGAEGTYVAGQRQFDATLFFRSNGLYQIDLNLKGDIGCRNLLSDMTSIYGRPMFIPSGSIDSWSWSDKSRMNKIELISPGYGFCTLRYNPLSSGL